MTHNINAEVVTLKLRRSDVSYLMRLLNSLEFEERIKGSTAESPENRETFDKRADRFSDLYDNIKKDFVKHEDKAKMNGWRV